MIRPCSFLIWLCLALPCGAVTPSEILPDAKLEVRARALSSHLRCLVCQNQSIDDSDAELAGDLRKIVREHLVAGESDEAIMKYLVARYGDFILLNPPFKLETLLLWGTPALALLMGGVVLFRAGRRRAVDAGGAAPLSDAEQGDLARMIERE